MPEARHEIERRPLPSFREFKAEYMPKRREDGRPVIFTGVVEQWPASRRWSFEWFAENHGDVRAPARVFKPGPKAFDEVWMPLRDLLGSGAPTAYLCNFDLGKLIPTLAADCPFPPFFLQRLTERQYWIGGAGTISTLHRDFVHNLFAQVKGRKRFQLFGLSRDPELAAVNTTWYSSFSSLDFGGPLKLPIPDYDFEIEAGELLFMPYAWWHRVTSLAPSISANLFWWNPTLAAKRVPVMLYANAREAATHTARRWRDRITKARGVGKPER